MVTEIKRSTIANRTLIFQMRQAGSPMREIAEKCGISKERVRQILTRNIGSTKHQWFSTLQLCEEAKLPRNRVLELQRIGVITPAFTWGIGKRHYLLWAPEAVRAITNYYNDHHFCQVCNKPLPKKRILFCSDACRQERHKYKYMTLEEKKRVLTNIRRYRERKRQESQALISSVLPQMTVSGPTLVSTGS
jgi:predicted nucleic acid-binding Zn ribbon protein